MLINHDYHCFSYKCITKHTQHTLTYIIYTYIHHVHISSYIGKGRDHQGTRLKRFGQELGTASSLLLTFRGLRAGSSTPSIGSILSIEGLILQLFVRTFFWKAILFPWRGFRASVSACGSAQPFLALHTGEWLTTKNGTILINSLFRLFQCYRQLPCYNRW